MCSNWMDILSFRNVVHFNSNASITIKLEHVTTIISNGCTQRHVVIIYIRITGQWKQQSPKKKSQFNILLTWITYVTFDLHDPKATENQHCEHELRIWILQDLCVWWLLKMLKNPWRPYVWTLKNHEAKNEDFLTLSEQPRDGIIITMSKWDTLCSGSMFIHCCSIGAGEGVVSTPLRSPAYDHS
jgi:hypothetical protein